jgi:glucokinase
LVGKKGHPHMPQVSAAAMLEAIGIDLGGTSIRGARVSATGEVLAHLEQATDRSAPAAMAQIEGMIAALDCPQVGCIGIGVPSRVDVKSGKVLAGGYVDLSGLPMAGRLKAPRGRPVVCDNDGNMALLAEARAGAGRGLGNVVMLTIGTGIGGGVMLDGAVVHGKGTAGELGHITVAYDGLPCVCGRKGCMETLSSGTALRRHIAGAGLPAGTKAEDLLARNDVAARTVIASWIAPLRAGIDSLVASFDPEKVVLGGGLGGVACEALAGFPPGSDWFQAEVVPSQLGSRAGVIGAALAALDHAA